ncbi:MAG: hypothetical protein AB7G28_20745 [Pirellulales bacterium]
MRRTLLFLAAVLWASNAGAGLNDVTQCPDDVGCPALPGETVLTTAIATGFYDTPTADDFRIATVYVAFPNGVADVSLQGKVVSAYTRGYMPDPQGLLNLSLVDGQLATSYELTHVIFGVSSEYDIYNDPASGVVGGTPETTITIPQLFTDGIYGGWTVDSNVTLVNGFDLFGLNTHLRKVLISSGEPSVEAISGGYRTTAQVTVQFIGAAGALPEPASLFLIACCGAFLCCRRHSCQPVSSSVWPLSR